MPLPASGPLSLDNIQTEFGGSAPTSISEYYRGALVPNISVNNNVPTSGQISFSNLYSAEQIDYVPTTFNINNVSVSGNDYVEVDTNTITLAGINTPITLNIGTTTARAQASGTSFPVAVLTLEVFKNSVSAGSVTWQRNGNGSTGNLTRNMKVTVSSGDTLYFKFSVDVTSSGDSGDGGGTVSPITWDITNDSSSNTSIDTFTTEGSATLI